MFDDAVADATNDLNAAIQAASAQYDADISEGLGESVAQAKYDVAALAAQAAFAANPVVVAAQAVLDADPTVAATKAVFEAAEAVFNDARTTLNNAYDALNNFINPPDKIDPPPDAPPADGPTKE